MRDNFLWEEDVRRNLARENPKLDLGTVAGCTEPIRRGSVGEGVGNIGNIWMGRSGIHLSRKRESFQYRRSAPSIEISVCGS